MVRDYLKKNMMLLSMLGPGGRGDAGVGRGRANQGNFILRSVPRVGILIICDVPEEGILILLD